MYTYFESIPEQIQGPGNNPIISSTRGVNNHVRWWVRMDGGFAASLLMGPPGPGPLRGPKERLKIH